jgi:hypothetical protein
MRPEDLEQLRLPGRILRGGDNVFGEKTRLQIPALLGAKGEADVLLKKLEEYRRIVGIPGQ